LLEIIFRQLNEQSGGRRSEELIGENGLLKPLTKHMGYTQNASAITAAVPETAKTKRPSKATLASCSLTGLVQEHPLAV
jgi:hypothetical protein